MPILSYNPVMQFFDEHGKPLVGGFLCTYIAGTNTPVSTLADEYGARNPVRIPLNMRGECVAYLDDGMHYKFRLIDKHGDTAWTIDNIHGQLQFDVTGNDQIGIETSYEEGHKVMQIFIKPNSIGREQLKNYHNFIPDSRYLQFKDFDGKVVVTLCDALQAWLETEGYTP